MLIDIHVHCRRTRYPVAAPAGSLSYPLPHELIRMMDAAGIDKAVLLPGMNPECAWGCVTVEETLEIASLYPSRFIPFATLDARNIANSAKTDFRPLLRYFKEAGCKGIGEYCANLPFNHPMQLNLFKQIEEFGLPLLFHIGPTIGDCYGCYDKVGLPFLEKALKACPNLIFLGHSQPFWAEISTVTQESRKGYPKGKVKPGRLVHLLREYPNLWGDLSAGSGHNALTRDPEFGYRFLEEFQDRLLFGTDICSYPQKLPQIPYFRELKKKEMISPEAYEKVTWRNANRLLNLGITEEEARRKREKAPKLRVY